MMSSTPLNWAFKVDVSPVKKVVLLSLADLSDDYGRVSCSLIELAKKASLNVEELNQVIGELKSLSLAYQAPQQSLQKNDPSPIDNVNIHLLLTRSYVERRV